MAVYIVYLFTFYIEKTNSFSSQKIEKRYVEMTSFDKDVNGQVKVWVMATTLETV